MDWSDSEEVIRKRIMNREYKIKSKMEGIFIFSKRGKMIFSFQLINKQGGVRDKTRILFSIITAHSDYTSLLKNTIVDLC